jgi:peptidoglycan/LPS O-acetylase OafA/YrhL
MMNGSPEARIIGAILRSGMGAAVVWLLFFGLTGLFLRHLDRPSGAIRYLVDSSYWIYIVHFPFMFWIPGVLSGLAWSPWAKMAIVLSLTSLIGVVSYDLLVRSSAIGAALNGRRYQRGLPTKKWLQLKPEQA